MYEQEGILSAVGRTPLVRLSRIGRENDIRVYAKLEFMNPGGSSKDRPGAAILAEALRSGIIRPGSTVIESSSGNMAISLAQVCAYHGLGLIVVVDPKTTKQNLRIMQALNSRIEYVSEPIRIQGNFLTARLKRVQELLTEVKDSYWPNQYANTQNALVHYNTTMKEIVELLPQIDYLFCGVSTCGTLNGCARYVKDYGMRTKLIAVDAAGSAIFGGPPSKRLLPGLGAVITPELCPKELVEEVVYVSDIESIQGCRKLVRKKRFSREVPPEEFSRRSRS